MLYD
jgi:HEAT repeat protein